MLINRWHKEGKPIGEIAKLLNRPYTTVRKRVESFVAAKSQCIGRGRRKTTSHYAVRAKGKPALDATSHCEVCEKSKPTVDFDSNVVHHAKYHGRRCVCLACTADGYSPRDIHRYPCAECGLKGHLKFAKQDLKSYKKPGRSAYLVCTDCIAKHNTIRKLLCLRHRCGCTSLGKINNPGRIRARMRFPTSTCLGKINTPGRVGDNMRFPTSKKCVLHQRFTDDDFWPGMDHGVSRAEFDFFARLTKRQRR